MANPQESALHYPFGETLPAPGTTLEVAPGVRWLRMGLPFALDHINLWLLRDRDDAGREGWTIVDCGIDNPATRAHWERIFEHELQGLPVLRVICTHMHPDHLGLAHWLCERWSSREQECRLWISSTDWHAGRLASQATTGFGGEDMARFFARHGLTDEHALAQVRGRGNYYANLVPRVPTRFRRLMDGLVLRIGGRDWNCISGYGHAPEHMALHCADIHGQAAAGADPAACPDSVLISGDMVLPRISTNVSVYDAEPEANPLPLYLASIARLLALPASTRVLPSHGKPFSGLHERIGQLTAHHDERFADVLLACAEGPKSAAELLQVIFRRSLDLHQTTFAMGEAVAHLHALDAAGRLRPEAGADGVLRYGTVAG
jgi:glyoxylase-like metal-dependent hydrolase (beta-lactamase superfamily II)